MQLTLTSRVEQALRLLAFDQNHQLAQAGIIAKTSPTAIGCKTLELALEAKHPGIFDRVDAIRAAQSDAVPVTAGGDGEVADDRENAPEPDA